MGRYGGPRHLWGPSVYGDNDLPVFFADMGVSVIWEDQTARGILDQAVDPFQHGAGPGAFQRATLTLRFAYNAFTGTPQPRDPITVAGVNYTVLDLPPQEDPQIVILRLKLA